MTQRDVLLKELGFMQLFYGNHTPDRRLLPNGDTTHLFSTSRYPSVDFLEEHYRLLYASCRLYSFDVGQMCVS